MMNLLEFACPEYIQDVKYGYLTIYFQVKKSQTFLFASLRMYFAKDICWMLVVQVTLAEPVTDESSYIYHAAKDSEALWLQPFLTF